MGTIYDWSVTPAANATADNDINWAEGQAPSTVNNSARQLMGRVAEFIDDLGSNVTVSGTADAIAVAINSAISAYATRQRLVFKAASTNTAAATLNVNTIGAKPLRKIGAAADVDIAAGDIQAGNLYEVIYSEDLNSGSGGWQLMGLPSVRTVSGRVGDVTMTSDDVGLDNVDNTSDADKPISTATQTALDGKQASLGYTPVNRAGDTMTGNLTLKNNPTSTLMAATKQYVDAGDANQLGVGQTWVDVTASRNNGTSYRNTTGKPIMVNLSQSGKSPSIQVSVNNSTWVTVAKQSSGDSEDGSLSAIIPNNHYYRSQGGFYLWTELR